MVAPELSNLHIATAGAGFRPIRKTSLDLVYHNHHQIEASSLVRDWEIDQDPNVQSTDMVMKSIWSPATASSHITRAASSSAAVTRAMHFATTRTMLCSLN